jgi:hypothetical protein
MAALGEVFSALAKLWGGAECWGEAADHKDRWRLALALDSIVGREVQEVWERLQVQATQAANYLGEEMPKLLAVPVQGIGEGSIPILLHEGELWRPWRT